MKSCEQTSGQSIYQHGYAVWGYLDMLTDSHADTSGMRIPDWYTDNRDFIIHHTYPTHILVQYAVYHDCGKPYCMTIDSDGRKHFPDHAAMSRVTWDRIFGTDADNGIISELIGLDMIFHTETWEQIESRSLSRETTCTLLCSALAELHANADMFGGIESTSFKIKWKRLQRLGNRAIRALTSVAKH